MTIAEDIKAEQVITKEKIAAISGDVSSFIDQIAVLVAAGDGGTHEELVQILSDAKDINASLAVVDAKEPPTPA